MTKATRVVSPRAVRKTADSVAPAKQNKVTPEFRTPAEALKAMEEAGNLAKQAERANVQHNESRGQAGKQLLQAVRNEDFLRAAELKALRDGHEGKTAELKAVATAAVAEHARLFKIAEQMYLDGPGSFSPRTVEVFRIVVRDSRNGDHDEAFYVGSEGNMEIEANLEVSNVRYHGPVAGIVYWAEKHGFFSRTISQEISI